MTNGQGFAKQIRRVEGKVYVHHFFTSSYTALYTIINAKAITNIERPTSSQNGFVFNETLLPILAPAIEPIRTQNAGNQIISPLCQYIGIAPKAVKIDTVNEVAIA
jgi:hypothetical protein